MNPMQDAYLQQRTNQILRAHIQNGTAALYGSGITAGGRCPNGKRKDPKTGKCKKVPAKKKAARSAVKRPCARSDRTKGRAALMKPNRKKCPKDYYNIAKYPNKYITPKGQLARINLGMASRGLIKPLSKAVKQKLEKDLMEGMKIIDEGKEPRPSFISKPLPPIPKKIYGDEYFYPDPINPDENSEVFFDPSSESDLFATESGQGMRRRRRGGVSAGIMSGGCEECDGCCGSGMDQFGYGCSMCGGEGVLVGGAYMRRCPKNSTRKIVKYNRCISNKTGKRVRTLKGSTARGKTVKRSGSKSAKAKVNPWNKFLKAYIEKHPNLSFPEASKKASVEYRKKR